MLTGQCVCGEHQIASDKKERERERVGGCARCTSKHLQAHEDAGQKKVAVEKVCMCMCVCWCVMVRGGVGHLRVIR